MLDTETYSKWLCFHRYLFSIKSFKGISGAVADRCNCCLYRDPFCIIYSNRRQFPFCYLKICYLA